MRLEWPRSCGFSLFLSHGMGDVGIAILTDKNLNWASEKNSFKTFTAACANSKIEIQKVRSLASMAMLTFLWAEVSDKHANSGKSFWICQINKLPSFPCPIRNPTLLGKSVIDKWTAFFILCAINQSSAHLTVNLRLIKQVMQKKINDHPNTVLPWRHKQCFRVRG